MPYLIQHSTVFAASTGPFDGLKKPPVQSTGYRKEQDGNDVLEILDHTLWPGGGGDRGYGSGNRYKSNSPAPYVTRL